MTITESLDPARINGMIVWTTRTASFAMIVKANAIVDAAPMARRWAMGREPAQIWAEGIRRGVHLTWIPLTATPRSTSNG